MRRFLLSVAISLSSVEACLWDQSNIRLERLFSLSYFLMTCSLFSYALLISDSPKNAFTNYVLMNFDLSLDIIFMFCTTSIIQSLCSNVVRNGCWPKNLVHSFLHGIFTKSFVCTYFHSFR